MQFDFTLGASQSQQLDVKGKFFKLVTATGKVRVKTNTGESIDLLPGQGVWGVDYQWLNVQDRTGANNAGTILAGDFDFHDDRISGTVDVVDGGKARTNAGLAFMGSIGQYGNPGEMAYVQLWNPAGSGRNLVIENVMLACTSAGQVNFGPSNAAMTNVFVNPPLSKKFAGGQGATVAQLRANSSAADLLGNSFGNLLIGANMATPYQFKEPIVLAPGYGFLANASTVNTKLIMICEYFEEPIQ